MRKLEEKGAFWLAGSRMKAGDKANPDSFKVRRAKVGGYRDYFDDAQLVQLDALTEARLLPGFGYLAARAAGTARGRLGLRRGLDPCYNPPAPASGILEAIAHEAMRLHPHQPEAVSRRAGVDALDAAQLAPCRRVRRQADRVRDL